MAKTGLVLEGGGMRGVFTAGVLDFFLEKGLTFDNIYAVSAGACHACSYIAGQRGRALRVAVNYLDDPRYCGMRSFLKTGDFFGVKFCYDTIPNRLDPMDYAAALRYPGHFYAVVTNCRTGKAEYIESRDMKKNISAIRASASLPLLSRMVPIDGQNYLDGGVADSIPLSKSMADGNEKHVLILTQMASYRKQPNRMMPAIRARYRRWPKLVQALGDRHIRYNRTLEQVARQEAAGNAFVLRPQKPSGIGRIEKDPQKLRALYQAGHEEAKRRWPELECFLNE